jgi:maleylacetoacetate isomerase
MAIQLYGFWRSSAAFRVRAALNLKGLAYTETMVDIDAGAQFDPAYLALNPQGAVPCLVIAGGPPIIQSLAILEYLEELYPQPALLPPDALGRARVRSLALVFAADHHPLLVPRVRRHLAEALGADEAQQAAWSAHWVRQSLVQGEARLAGDPATGRFCHGDTPTFADLCMLSQVMSARLLKMDTTDLPTVNRVADAAFADEAIARAHPRRQPGAPIAS